MRKIILFLLLCTMVQGVRAQWDYKILSDEFTPLVSVTAYDSVVIAGSTSLGPHLLAVSHDFGEHWSGSDPFQATDVYYLCNSGSGVFACTSEGIFRASKDSLCWSAFNEGLPAGRIWKMVVKDSIMLAFGNGILFVRMTGDTCWSTLCESSPVAGILDVDFDGNTIVIAGNNGIAESFDMGTTWSLWPPSYEFQWNAVTVQGDTIIAASKDGGAYRKLISSGTITNISEGLHKIWNPYGYDYYGYFEMFHRVGDWVFLCGETGVYLLSAGIWRWEHTHLGEWSHALANNGEYLYAVTGYWGCWTRTLDGLIVNTVETPAPSDALSIFPNPSARTIQIETGSFSLHNAFLTVYDLQGQQLLQTRIHTPSATLDISGFPQGVCIIKLSDGTNTRFGKFVRQ